MKLNKILRNTANIIKDEPINTDERIEVLEKKFTTKFSQLEDSLATVHSVIERMGEENDILKKENTELKKALSNRELVSNSLLDGIKEKVVKPIMDEGKELAHLVFEEDTNENQQIENKNKFKVKTHTIEPETEFDKYKKAKDPVPQLEEKSHSTHTKAKTIKWMRQKFGLSPHIEEKTTKTKKKRSKK